MAIYTCRDACGVAIDIEADTPREAAQEYVDGAEWENASTMWHHIHVREVGRPDDEGETFDITLPPPVPECCGDAHDWQSPHDLLGGLKENPGVWGHGGGVKIREVCAHCGVYRVTDTWATDPETGQQGLESIEYQDADEESLAWIRRD